jgi:hypothetical protein
MAVAELGFAILNDIIGQGTHQSTDQFADEAGQFQFTIASPHRLGMGARQGRLNQITHFKQSCSQAIVDVVIDISDIVSQGRDLRFQPRPVL